MLYKLKEIKQGVIDSIMLNKNNISCNLISKHKVNMAFSDLTTYKKIGVIAGFNLHANAITKKQIEILNDYAKRYANIINIFRRMDERKSKIDYLTFLADINKSVPRAKKFSDTLKRILYMISKTLNFDFCAFVLHDKGKIPNNVGNALNTYYCRTSLCKDIVRRISLHEYPVVPKINEYRIKNQVFGSSFSYLGVKNEITKYFDEFVIIPLNGLDDSKINYIICLNRIDKKILSKKAITQLELFQTQILSTLKNMTLVNDIKEYYEDLKELHALSNRLNFITREDKIIQNAFDEIMGFFNAQAGAVYYVHESLPRLLFFKNIDTDNSSAYNFVVELFKKVNSYSKTVISSSDMPDFIDFNTKFSLKSQIMIFITHDRKKQYLFFNSIFF